MINIDGTLTVKVRTGNYGNFNVGELKTSIGVFSVKDKILDQYDEGTFKGSFTISKIYAHSYTPRGSCFTINEVRADLAEVTLYGIDDCALDEDIKLIQDPLDEEKESVSIKPKKTPSKSTSNKSSKSNKSDEDDLSKLFGELWPLLNEVKLDSTCSRDVVRKQKAYLKENGYEFVPREQIWTKS